MSESAAPQRPRRKLLPRFLATAAPSSSQTATTVEHLTELRTRIIWVLATAIVAFAAAYWQSTRIFAALTKPLDGRFDLVTFGVTEPFMTLVTVSAYVALIVSVPMIVFHSYRYIAPAMTREQRRSIRPYLLALPALFATGVAFGYQYVLGPSVRFLLGMGADKFTVQVRAQEYYSFVSMTLLGMGLIFLTPIFVLGIARIGLVNSGVLRKQRRFAILGAAVIAALLPTADPVSLAIEMMPLIALYELSIVLVRLQERASRARD